MNKVSKLMVQHFYRCLNRVDKHHIKCNDSDKIIKRFNGKDNCVYNWIWNKLDGDHDPYLFEDYCEMGMQLPDNTGLSELPKERSHKIFLLSAALLCNYYFRIWIPMYYFGKILNDSRHQLILATSFVVRWVVLPLYKCSNAIIQICILALDTVFEIVGYFVDHIFEAIETERKK